MKIPLFERYPALAGSLAWIPLGNLPTSVQRLERTGRGNIWIKRDDRSSEVYGGNKVRKLEFILADALRRGKRHVVTMGGIGTNHGLATAVFCQRLGLGCTLLLFDQPLTSYVRQNLLLFGSFKARLVYTRTILKTGLAFYTTARLMYPRAYFLYAGGSSPVGTLGFVNAAFELRQQVADGLLPCPHTIFCPLGSNGTLAGLALGTALAGIDTEVVGVRVTASHLGPLPMATPETVLALMRRTHALMRKNDAGVPTLELRAPRVLDAYFGRAYGDPTSEGLRALKELEHREGIRLDPTYTSKTFAAVLDSEGKAPILYWHTYNSADLTPLLKDRDYRDLPSAFQRFYRQAHVPV